MATCSAVIARALRLARVVAIGDEATAEEADEGMTALQSFYARLCDARPRNEVYDTADYDAAEGDRVYTTGAVTLPATVVDNDTGAERRPADLAVIQYNENGAGWQTWLSDRGDWVRIDDLEEADDAPLSARNMEGLACAVALDLAETFGKEVSAQSRANGIAFKAQCWPRKTTPNEFF